MKEEPLKLEKTIHEKARERFNEGIFFLKKKWTKKFTIGKRR